MIFNGKSERFAKQAPILQDLPRHEVWSLTHEPFEALSGPRSFLPPPVLHSQGAKEMTVDNLGLLLCDRKLIPECEWVRSFKGTETGKHFLAVQQLSTLMWVVCTKSFKVAPGEVVPLA